MKLVSMDYRLADSKNYLPPLELNRARYAGAAMTDALDEVLIGELDYICATGDEGWFMGVDLLDKLLAMPKQVRSALAKRLMEDA
jgi:hypothetical protein